MISCFSFNKVNSELYLSKLLFSLNLTENFRIKGNIFKSNRQKDESVFVPKEKRTSYFTLHQIYFLIFSLRSDEVMNPGSFGPDFTDLESGENHLKTGLFIFAVNTNRNHKNRAIL